eukprot:COSAG01_NODE_9_length_43729_cov_66.133463_23_plen_350_part_00
MNNKPFADLLDFEVPEHLIAHQPNTKRDASRLLHVNIDKNILSHQRFCDLVDLLRDDDMIILNDSKVMPARLFAQRASGAKIEILLLHEQSPQRWQALIKPQKKVMLKETLYFPNMPANNQVQVIEKSPTACLLQFAEGCDVHALMDAVGHVPLPPYIKADAAPQATRYQTVYAKHRGAVAAPTAGLHFTEDLLTKLKEKDIQIETVTLHVGYGTFQPLQAEHLAANKLHEEHFYIAPETAQRIMQHKGRRIAVGTTSARSLESAWMGDAKTGGLKSGWQATELLIKPGFQFKVCDCLISNFHLPQTSLLLLVAAFASQTLIQEAYQTAIAETYRFYSFGDAMFLDKHV